MWFVIITILVIFLMIVRLPSGYTRHMNKTVWLLWLQGWDNPPYLIDKVRQTWVKNNPGWKIQLVSRDNLSDFIDVSKIPWKASPAAQSDVIRIHLLEKYGGVWADATLACVEPLDSWVDTSSIWMYRGSLLFADGKGPASWFIIARPGSYSVRRWKEKVDEYWKDREETSTFEYFWLDSLWWDLYKNDPKFAAEWDSFESPSRGPDMMDGKVNGSSKEVQDNFLKNPPHVVKLSHKEYDSDDQDTNGNIVLRKIVLDYCK